MFSSGAAKKQEKIRDGSEEFQKLATAIRKIKQTTNDEALKVRYLEAPRRDVMLGAGWGDMEDVMDGMEAMR